MERAESESFWALVRSVTVAPPFRNLSLISEYLSEAISIARLEAMHCWRWLLN